MAASGYITVNQNAPMGLLALQIRDLLVQVIDKSAELGEALGQAAGDDQTNGKLMTVLGTATSADADAVKNLVGSVRTALNDGGNAFLQYAARINRAGV